MPKTQKELSGFAVALKAYVQNALNAEMSLTQISDKSGVNRTTVNKVISGEASPEMSTVRKLVQYFNSIGFTWDENTALVDAGFQEYERIIEARMPITIEAMPYMTFETRVYDANRMAESKSFNGLDYSNKTNALKLTTATVGIIGLSEYEGYVVLVETIGEIVANTRLVIKTVDNIIEIRDVADPAEIEGANVTLIGTVIGYFSSDDPNSLQQQSVVLKRRSGKSAMLASHGNVQG